MTWPVGVAHGRNHVNFPVARAAIEQGDFEFEDADRNTLKGDRRLMPFLTIKDGQVWWRREQEEHFGKIVLSA